MPRANPSTYLKVEKVKNFQRNYLESEKFFSKFSRYFLERENFQNLKVRIPENFSLNFRFFESEKIFKI